MVVGLEARSRPQGERHVSCSTTTRHRCPRARSVASWVHSGSGRYRADASHTGLEGLDSAWKVAATDYRLQAAQDRAMNRLFFEPAERRADVLGVRSPLGVVILYDTALQHGTGDGVDELGDHHPPGADRDRGRSATNWRRRNSVAPCLSRRSARCPSLPAPHGTLGRLGRQRGPGGRPQVIVDG